MIIGKRQKKHILRKLNVCSILLTVSILTLVLSFIWRKDQAGINAVLSYTHGVDTMVNCQHHLVLMQAMVFNHLHSMLWLHEIIALFFTLFFAFIIYYFLHRMISHHFSMKKNILSAIKNNAYSPMYQPIFDSTSKQFTGAEVLLRWNTETRMMTPEFFIDEAENLGLNLPISIQLIEKTFQEMQEILKSHSDFHLAFNFAANQFTDADFFTEFQGLCKQYAINPKQITLEVTERTLINRDDVQIIERMKTLRKQGFSLAVDDFGTGHASLNYLAHFPFNYLKIDKLFVQAIGTGAITESLNESIIHLANNLKLHIVAEGVETKAQYEFLIANQVHLLQGWYFAQAMAYDELIKFLELSPHE